MTGTTNQNWKKHGVIKIQNDNNNIEINCEC